MQERNLLELYNDDPERADALIWNRRWTPSRRNFMSRGSLALFAVAVGAQIPFGKNLHAGDVPVAVGSNPDFLKILRDSGLTVLNDRPINAETPAHLLDDNITPNARHFVRNNGLVPESAQSMNPNAWELQIDGEVHSPLKINLHELKTKYPTTTLALQLECGGNGRAGYYPPAKGNQWTLGAVGCSKYTGVRLGDILKQAGLKSSAKYTGYYGSDEHLSRVPGKVVISRGTPIHKALDPHTLIAFEMNGKPLPALHGFPVRIVTPGWPGSTSPKWLKRIWVRDQIHDGPKMTGYAYRMPKNPVPPGANVPKSDMGIIETMPVKSLITNPRSKSKIKLGSATKFRGHAWAGDRQVKAVHTSIDFGASWQKAVLDKPVNKYAWQNWKTAIKFPMTGYYEVWARATDDHGIMQPMVVPGWNPKGYLNNGCHRIAIYVS